MWFCCNLGDHLLQRNRWDGWGREAVTVEADMDWDQNRRWKYANTYQYSNKSDIIIMVFLLIWASEGLVLFVLLCSGTTQLSEYWVANRHHPPSRKTNVRNGSWSIGKGPELLDVAKRDRVRYSNMFGMFSIKSFVLGSYAQRFLNSCHAFSVTALSATLVWFSMKDPTSDFCHCLPRVKPDTAPFTNFLATIRT